MHAVIWPMQTIPYQEIKRTYSLCWGQRLCAMFYSQWVFLCSAYSYASVALWLSVFQTSWGRKRGPFFAALGGAYIPIALHQLGGRLGQWMCIWVLLVMRDQWTLSELILLCHFPVSKGIVPCNAWLCCVFLGCCDAKMQRVSIVGLLILKGATVMTFATFHVVEVLSWHW